MTKGEVIEQVKNTQAQEVIPLTYSVEDLIKITDLFSILIRIDQKIKSKGGVADESKK